MDIDKPLQSFKQNYSAELLGTLILEELKGIRRDMKNEVKSLGLKLEALLSRFSAEKHYDHNVDHFNANSNNEFDFEETSPCVQRKSDFELSPQPIAVSKVDSVAENISKALQTDDNKANVNTKKDTDTIIYTSHSDPLISNQPNQSCTTSIKEEIAVPAVLADSKKSIQDKNFNSEINSLSQPIDFTKQSPFRHFAGTALPLMQQLPHLYSSIAFNNFKTQQKHSTFKSFSSSNAVTSLTCKALQRPTSNITKKAFECKICGKSFAKKSYAKMHVKVHNGEKPFECRVCKGVFLTNANLKRHMIVHTGEKPFTCVFCHKSFAFSTNLKRHMQIHLRQDESQDG